jgi:hypothetical protein
MLLSESREESLPTIKASVRERPQDVRGTAQRESEKSMGQRGYAEGSRPNFFMRLRKASRLIPRRRAARTWLPWVDSRA